MIFEKVLYTPFMHPHCKLKLTRTGVGVDDGKFFLLGLPDIFWVWENLTFIIELESVDEC